MSKIDKYHVVRECRNLCAEEGYSGESFRECIKECVKKVLGTDF